MALSSPFMEVLWLRQNTMIHSFWCQACNSSAIVARTSPRKKTELPKSTWISGFNDMKNMKMKYIIVPELHQPRLIKLRQDWSCKIVVETPQTDFSSSIRIPPSQSLQPSPAWPVNSEPQRHKFQTFQSQALLKATGKKIQKHIWNISNLHHIPINQLINQTATQMRGAHSGFSCDCNDCREQILSLCVCEPLRLRHKSSQLSIGWMPLHRIYFSWLLKLTKLYQITWIKTHPKPKNCSISCEESKKKTKTWSLDHPCWILSSLHLVFKKPKIEYLVQVKTVHSKHCKSQRAGWLLAHFFLIPITQKGIRMKTWRQRKYTNGRSPQQPFLTELMIHMILSPFHSVWWCFVRLTTIKIAPMIHGLTKIQTTKSLLHQNHERLRDQHCVDLR